MMDRINLDILRCLRENARCKASDISQQVNLSVSAVIERIRRMEASGVIRQYTVLIDPKQVGNDLTALMEVSLGHPMHYDDFVENIRKHPNVAECHYLTGEFDFLLKIITDSSDNLEQIIILGHGAVRVSASEFRQEVEAVNQSIRQVLEQSRAQGGGQRLRMPEQPLE